MKKSIALLVVAFSFGCSEKPTAEKYITANLPQGISVYGFNEQYDAGRGQYQLHFFLKNESGKKIDYPQIDGDLYVNGEKETVTGGPGKHLENLDSGVVSFATILPKQVPDSIVFKLVE